MKRLIASLMIGSGASVVGYWLLAGGARTAGSNIISQLFWASGWRTFVSMLHHGLLMPAAVITLVAGLLYLCWVQAE
ncbi:MAG: hypothetical protein AAB817_02395 [Patescibacteria group bacterium]